MDKKSYVQLAKELYLHLMAEEAVTPDTVAAGIFGGGEVIPKMFIAFLLGKGYTLQEIKHCEATQVQDTVEFIKENWE